MGLKKDFEERAIKFVEENVGLVESANKEYLFLTEFGNLIVTGYHIVCENNKEYNSYRLDARWTDDTQLHGIHEKDGVILLVESFAKEDENSNTN